MRRVWGIALACCSYAADRSVKERSFCDVTSRGTPYGPYTPPHTLFQVVRARRLPGGVRASTSSLSAASSSSSAALPVRGRTLRWTGYMLDIQPPAPGRRCRRAGGALPVQYGYQAGHAGVCSAPHRNHHVAPRSATTLASECCTCEVQAAHAEPSSGEPARTTH